jgi:hypothetical protein
MIHRLPLIVYFLGSLACASDWYVAPDGKSENKGSKEAPWDIASALSGAKKSIVAGDTVWLTAGAYKTPDRTAGNHGFEVKLAGSKDKPVIVRSVQGARATIDGGFIVVKPADWLWIRDLEFALSEPPQELKEGGSHPVDVRPWGGIDIQAGSNCKFINLIMHNNSQGMGFWTGATDSEVYGCIFYENGWKAPDRGHGHCIYTQNKDGVKKISNCIMQAGYDGAYTLHAYGSAKADCDNFLIEDNICWHCGPFLIGSGKPSHNIKVFHNYLYGIPMRIGYGAENEDCEIRDNVVVNGDIQIKKYKNAVNEGNLVLSSSDKRPPAPKIAFLPNAYDDSRAHLAIYNFSKQPAVDVKMEKFVKAGENVKLFNPKDLFGKPVWEGKVNGDALSVPTPAEFNVFVVIRN